MSENIFGITLIEDENEENRILRLIDFVRALAIKMELPVMKLKQHITTLTDHKGELTVDCIHHFYYMKDVIAELWDEQFGEYQTVFNLKTEGGYETLTVDRSAR